RALSALILMQTYYNHFMEVSGSMENMTNFENELDMAREKFGKQKIESFKEDIQIKDVSFSYADLVILKNINLTIKKNETIAFVGDSGSGKTTLINILSGLMPVTTGKVLIDGVEYKDIEIQYLQNRIGYITQEPVIFNDTIYNNVTFWEEINEKNYK